MNVSNVSILSYFYRYHLHERRDSLNHLLHGRMLTQQWVTEVLLQRITIT